MKVTFWKFVSHNVSTTHEQAEALARRIEAGDFKPANQHGEMLYKSGGWAFDLGRKPYLVQYADGHIQRAWASSVAELRESCYLSRRDKVVADPFYKEAA
jgi:hypothetical protein